jgi:hypothetical protein
LFCEYDNFQFATIKIRQCTLYYSSSTCNTHSAILLLYLFSSGGYSI